MSRKMETKEEQKEMDKPFDFDTFDIKTVEDFHIWNLHARKAFREAKKRNPRCDPPIHVRVPDESFHKKVKVKFQRFDQPENVLKVHVRNRDIDWRGQLIPGGSYELPLPVIRFLNKLSVPIFAEVKVESAGEVKSETKQVGERSRFSCQSMELL
jgi:hypothetical protein